MYRSGRPETKELLHSVSNGKNKMELAKTVVSK